MKGYVPPELEQIREQVREGKRPVVSVRTLLAWFGCKRRGSFVVDYVEAGLAEAGLETEPHFNWINLDGPVVFIPTKNGAASSAQPDIIAAPDAAQVRAPVEPSVVPDPTYRIGRLEIANRTPVSVAPDTSIQDAVTIMLMNDYSQLPVIVRERQVKGIFSWRSLGSRLSQELECRMVKDAMDDCEVVDVNVSLFEAVERLKSNDCVLIRDGEGKISGVMTAYDVSITFGQLGEPFFILGEIENHIRGLMVGRFTNEELTASRDSKDGNRTIQKISDLALGEYLRILENPDFWERLGLRIDRATFVKKLDEIRVIRNDVMHFDPEGIDPSDVKTLRNFVAFLQRLQKLRRTEGIVCAS